MMVLRRARSDVELGMEDEDVLVTDEKDDVEVEVEETWLVREECTVPDAEVDERPRLKERVMACADDDG